MEIRLSQFTFTKIVVITPYYLLVNQTEVIENSYIYSYIASYIDLEYSLAALIPGIYVLTAYEVSVRKELCCRVITKSICVSVSMQLFLKAWEGNKKGSPTSLPPGEVHA